jgi:hypothetical protein
MTTVSVGDPPDVRARGEVDCFGCDMRLLEKHARKARLANPAGLYCDGVEVCFCDKPRCNQMADGFDAKYGRPASRQ